MAGAVAASRAAGKGPPRWGQRVATEFLVIAERIVPANVHKGLFISGEWK